MTEYYIPEQLPPKVTAHGLGTFPVTGNCLEGAGICDGDTVTVDFDKRPQPPLYKSKDCVDRRDICLCSVLERGKATPTLMIKEYLGVWGGLHMVTTHYTDRLNMGKPAEEILGVVFACRDSADRLKWECDISGCPAQLGTAPTMRSADCSDPAPIAREQDKLDGLTYAGEVISESGRPTIPVYDMAGETAESWNMTAERVFLRRYTEEQGSPPEDFEGAYSEHLQRVNTMIEQMQKDTPGDSLPVRVYGKGAAR